jgi:hypothetical protein
MQKKKCQVQLTQEERLRPVLTVLPARTVPLRRTAAAREVRLMAVQTHGRLR